MKHLTIEWRHLELNKGTCLRCSKTGKTLYQVISDLQNELKSKGVKITLNETKLSEKNIQQSNMILINDKPLEQILPKAKVAENYCASCSCITGNETHCRTIQYDGKSYEEIPEEIIRKAVLKVVGLNENGEKL